MRLEERLPVLMVILLSHHLAQSMVNNSKKKQSNKLPNVDKPGKTTITDLRLILFTLEGCFSIETFAYSPVLEMFIDSFQHLFLLCITKSTLQIKVLYFNWNLLQFLVPVSRMLR